MPKLPPVPGTQMFANIVQKNHKFMREIHEIGATLEKRGVGIIPTGDLKYNFNENPGLTPGALEHAKTKDEFINKR